VAFDLSLVATGVCGPTGLTETVRSNKKGMDRLYDIESAVLNRCDWFDSQAVVDLAVLEGFSYHSKSTSGRLFDIGGLGYIVRLALFKADIPFTLIAPKSMKLYATGSGKAQKPEIIAAARAASGRGDGIRDEHQSDAYWLWQMALAHYDRHNEWRVKVPKIQRAALDNVGWIELEVQ
jgi:Holliday junction resolvasome RuvABC endonuclease subunit